MPQGRSRLLRSTLTGVFIVHYEMVEGAHTRLFALVHSGGDGSRQVTAKVDATGKGTKFVAMTVTTNGNAVSFASVEVQCIPILMIVPVSRRSGPWQYRFAAYCCFASGGYEMHWWKSG